MPIYEYICECCGHRLEILHRGSQEEKPTCPECGATDVRRVFSVFGFSSGGGFASSGSKGTSCSSCRAGNCSSCG